MSLLSAGMDIQTFIRHSYQRHISFEHFLVMILNVGTNVLDCPLINTRIMRRRLRNDVKPGVVSCSAAQPGDQIRSGEARETGPGQSLETIQQ